MYESVLNVMEDTIPEYTVSNYIREGSGSVLSNVVPYVYDCKDGSFIIGANKDTVFRRLCEAMDRPELAADERYSTHIARGANQAELDDIVNDWMMSKTMAEVDELMIANDVPASYVYRAR